MRAFAFATILSTALVVVMASTSMAAPPAFARVAQTAEQPVLAQATPSLSAEEAAALVQARSGGQVLDVRLKERRGELIYLVKVLMEGGRVRVYRVDADSGRVSRRRP